MNPRNYPSYFPHSIHPLVSVGGALGPQFFDFSFIGALRLQNNRGSPRLSPAFSCPIEKNK